jgi:peptidoglycan/xylan/chitin deacetylase (PgdA/CDA1 family)
MIRPHLLVDASLAAAGISLAAAWGPGLPLLALGAGVAGLHAWASVNPRASFYLPVTWRLPADETSYALTFDDGPDPEYTPAVLDLLARHGAHATFFVIGEHARRHPQLLRRIRRDGHALGLHSDRHSRWFNCWPAGMVRADLERCRAAIAAATGEPPPRLFRPPVGLKNPLVADAVAALGLVVVTWSARAWDTRGATPAAIAHRLRRAARPRAIVLLHDGHEPAHPRTRAATVDGLAMALPHLPGPSRALAIDTAGGIRLEPATDVARGQAALA